MDTFVNRLEKIYSVKILTHRKKFQKLFYRQKTKEQRRNPINKTFLNGIQYHSESYESKHKSREKYNNGHIIPPSARRAVHSIQLAGVEGD